MKYNLRRFRVCLFVLAGFLAYLPRVVLAAEESVTVTTYYPSPYGVYSEMRLYPKLESQATVCDQNHEGLMFYDRVMHAMRVCRCINTSCILTTDFTYSATNYWTLSGTSLYPNDTAWRVGIGTTNPGYALDIAGSSGVRIYQSSSQGQGFLYIGRNDINNGSGGIYFLSSNSATNWRIRQNDLVSGDLTFTPSTAAGGATFTTPTMSMLGNGNVGIGTTNPGTNKLDVAGTAQLRGAAGGTGLYVNPSGNVGIGTTNPGTNKLDIQGGDARFSGRIGAYGYNPSDLPGGWGGGVVSWDVVAKASVRTNALCLGGSVGGNDLGICRNSWSYLTSPSGQYSLAMQDDGNIVLYTPWGVRFDTATWGGRYGLDRLKSDNGQYLLVMQGDGNLVVYQGGTPVWWSKNTLSCASSCWSDASLKENIATLNGALVKIKQLRGISFRWKDKQLGEGPQIGLIAQEVEKVFPEVVGSISGFKSVDYGRLVSPLIEALKEQQAQIEAQGKLIKQLQDEFNAAKAKSESQ